MAAMEIPCPNNDRARLIMGMNARVQITVYLRWELCWF